MGPGPLLIFMRGRKEKVAIPLGRGEEEGGHSSYSLSGNYLSCQQNSNLSKGEIVEKGEGKISTN